MDMDFGKLFEMFEERFGRFAATALLLIVALAVAATSVHFVWLYLVRPVTAFAFDFYNYATGQENVFTRAYLYRLLLGVLSGGLGIAVFLGFVSFFVWPRLTRVVNECHAVLDECDAHCNANHEKLEQAAATLAQDLARAKRAGIDIERAVGQLTGPSNAVQRDILQTESGGRS